MHGFRVSVHTPEDLRTLEIKRSVLTGSSITAISIARLQSIVEFAVTANPTRKSKLAQNQHSENPTDKPTVDNAPAIYWSVLECDMFIICACLPAVRSILSQLIPGVFGGSSVHSSYPSGVKYYRHDGSESKGRKEDSSSLQLNRFDQPGKPSAGVSVNMYSEGRTTTDEDLTYPPSSRRTPGHGV